MGGRYPPPVARAGKQESSAVRRFLARDFGDNPRVVVTQAGMSP